MSASTHLTDAEIEAQGRANARHLARLLAWEALAELHEAAETIERGGHDADDLADYHLALRAVAHLADGQLGRPVDDTGAIPDWLAVERLDQLRGLDGADFFDPPWPRPARLEDLRRPGPALSPAAEDLFQRILADHADPSAIRTAKPRRGGGLADRIAEVEAEVAELRSLAQEAARYLGIER